MVSFLKWCIKAGIAGAASVALLSLFTLVYSNSGVHIANPSQATDYFWEPRQYKANMTEGFSWLRMDASGFNNEKDLADLGGVDILIMGSSHMEAVNVGRAENAGALLNAMLPEYKTYNIGISGHTFYHCVNNLEDALSFYQPTKYVVIETDRIALDPAMMESVINGGFAHIASYDSGWMYTVQKAVPAVLPVYRQLENWRAASARQPADTIAAASAGEGDSGASGEEYREVLDRFMGEIKRLCGDREVLVLYHPQTRIDAAGNFIAGDPATADVFRSACENNGLHFIDMEADFKALYEEKYILAHGFINTEVGAGHLNRYGHKVIADKIMNTIQEIDNGDE